MQLVDEEHRPGLERGQERRDVALALQRRARRRHEADAELGRDNAGQRRLPQTGWAGEEHVVERLAAPAGRLDRDRELALDLLLAHEVLKPLRAQRAVEVL